MHCLALMAALTEPTVSTRPLLGGSIFVLATDVLASCSKTFNISRPGYTCVDWAASTGLSLDQLYALNPGIDCNTTLGPGSELCLAAGESSAMEQGGVLE